MINNKYKLLRRGIVYDLVGMGTMFIPLIGPFLDLLWAPYAAKKMGADYILLIQSLFDQGFLKEIEEFIEYAHKKELKILLEVHTKQEFVNALKTKADLIGINNRNLDTLEINLKTTEIVLEGYEKQRLILSESGIETIDDIQYLKKCGADAFLVGSSIMKSNNIEEQVKKLVSAY